MDAILGIKNPALKRLMRKAAVKFASKLVYEEARVILKIKLEEIIFNLVYILAYTQKKKVTPSMIRLASKLAGIPLLAGWTKPVACAAPKKKAEKSIRRSKPGTVALREIKHYQKAWNCFSFRKGPFHKLVKETSTSINKDGFQYSKSAYDLLQTAIEQYMVNTFLNANMAAFHANRTRIMPKDLHLARRIAGERA